MACQIEYVRRSGRLANYHPPIVGPFARWKGKSWRDMPGNCEDLKKFNFALYRRGMHTGEASAASIERSARARAAKRI